MKNSEIMEHIFSSAKKFINFFWPFLLILLIVCLFFWKVIFKGLVTLPADITVGMYFPWLDYKWGYIVGVPVKNPLISDAIAQFYPFKLAAIEQMKNGLLPLWNNSLFGGYPLLANIQIGIFNPTNLFYFLLPMVDAWGLQTLFQPLLAALFTYLFLRSIKVGKFGSVLGAITYAFSGFNIIWLQLNIHGYATAFLPLLLFSVNKYLTSKKIFFGFLISVSICLQIFSGYPQILIYSMMGLGLYLLFFSGVFRKSTLEVAFFVLIGFLLSGIQLIPTIELFINAQRRFEVVPFNQLYLPWKNIISFFAPDYFGNPVTGNYWGVGDYTTVSGYAGLISTVLAGVSIYQVRKNKSVRFLFLLLFFSLCLAFPTPLLQVFYKLNFFGLGNSGSSRALFLSIFSISCLAAVGFDAIVKKTEKIYFRAFYPAFVVIFGYGIGTVLSIFLIKIANSKGAQIVGDKVSQQLINLNVGLRNLIFPVGIFFMVLLIFCLLYFLSNSSKKVRNRQFLYKCLLGIIFLSCIGEMFKFGWKFTPFSKKELVYPLTPVLSFLKERKGIFRVEGGDAVPMNMLTPYGLESLSAYDPLYPLRTAEYLSLIDNGTVKNPKGRYGIIENYGSKLFDLSNVCFLLSVNKDEKDKASIDGKPGYKFRLDKFIVVFRDKSVSVIENKNCLPRAFLVNDFVVESEKEKIAQLMTDKNFDPKKSIIIEKPFPIDLSKTEFKKSKVVYSEYLPGDETIKTTTSEPSFLFVSESFYPGWSAYLDGKKTEIFRSNYVFRSVFLPAGEHIVVFKYQPKSFEYAWKISLATFLGMAITLICAKIAPFQNFKKVVY